jgi:hypothetical protein
MLGTPAMQQQDPMWVWCCYTTCWFMMRAERRITCEDVAGMMDGSSIFEADVFTRIGGALENLTNQAAGSVHEILRTDRRSL